MGKDQDVIYKLKCISVISFIFMTVQIMGGIMANSIAILADAFHLLSDVLAYMISLQAVLMSHRTPPFYLTFGYEKLQPLGALVNVSIIWFVTMELVVEATERIINKSVVEDPLYMLLTSFFGLGCNLYIMRVLHSDVEHGGHSGCSHDHGHELQKLADSHNHEHNQSHQHTSSCSHSHQKPKKKASTCTHDHKNGHHDHHDHNHDHDHSHNHKNQHHDHNHVHGSGSSHQKIHDSTDSMQSASDIHRNIDINNQSFSSIESFDFHHQQQISLKSAAQQLNLSDEILKLKQKARKQLFKNINIQAAYIHIISDIILSIGVIISAIIIYFMADREQWTYWQLADPFCTYLFSVMAIYSTITVTKDSVIILLDGCDDQAMLKDVISDLGTIKQIESYEQLRVWSVNRAKFAAAVKVFIDKKSFQDLEQRDQIYQKVTRLFSEREISHYVQILAEKEKSMVEQ